MGDGEFRDLIDDGSLDAQESTDDDDARQRRLSGTLEGVPVVITLYETSLMVRAEIGARFPEALGVKLEIVPSGRSLWAGASREEGSFDRLFKVSGVRDGVPVRERLSAETKASAVRVLEQRGGELAIREGGVLWARTFGGERVELGGHGSEIVRAVVALAKRVWEEARTSDPAKQGAPAPPLTGAPASPRGAIVGGLVTLVFAALCIPLTVMTYHADLEIWIFIGALAALCLPIGGFLLGLGAGRSLRTRREGAHR